MALAGFGASFLPSEENTKELPVPEKLEVPGP